MVEDLAGLFSSDDLLTLTRLLLQVWQPVLGLPVLPIARLSRYQQPVGMEKPYSWSLCLSVDKDLQAGSGNGVSYSVIRLD